MTRAYPQDEQLLMKIKEGNQVLLKQLHGEYWAYFCSYFFKLGNLDRKEILEIYELSFTRFYLNIRDEKLIPPLKSNLKSYLIGIGKNYRLKYFDEKKRMKERGADDLETIQGAYLNPAIDDHYNKEALGDLIKKLLAQLKADCKQLIQLSYIEENADDAIAKKMDIASAGAVRQRRFKCMEKLRKIYQKFKDK